MSKDRAEKSAVWVTDPVRIAKMLDEPERRVIRNDFITEIEDEGQPVNVPCRVYWTPRPDELVHPGVAPVAPAKPPRPAAPPALTPEDYNDAERVSRQVSWFNARKTWAADHKQWVEVLLPKRQRESKAYDEELARYNSTRADNSTEVAGPPARIAADGPSMILTHGRGSNLDVPAVVGFNLGFARTQSSFCFSAGRDSEEHRGATFNALADKYRTDTYCGRSMGGRAANWGALHRTGIRKLIFFTYPLIRERWPLEDWLLDLRSTPDEPLDVLFVVGNDDARAPEILLHAVRKKMKVRTWWIRVILGDHGLFYIPEARRVKMAQVMGQLAAQWSVNRDSSRTELIVEWEGDFYTGRPRWTDWVALPADPKPKPQPKPQPEPQS